MTDANRPPHSDPAEDVAARTPVMTRPLLVALAAVGLLAIAGVLWAVFGRAPDLVTGPGIILPAGGYSAVTAPGAGHVDSVAVPPGHRVGAGQTVAYVRRANGRLLPVRSATGGLVMDVLVAPGTAVEQQQPIALVSPAGRRQEVRAFLPLAEAPAVEPGMRALVSPDGAHSPDYGAIEGVVTAVAGSATGPVRLRAVSARNPWVARRLAANAPVVEATVMMRPDADAPTGVRWTIGTGPARPLRTGQLATVSVTVSDPPIISRLVR